MIALMIAPNGNDDLVAGQAGHGPDRRRPRLSAWKMSAISGLMMLGDDGVDDQR